MNNKPYVLFLSIIALLLTARCTQTQPSKKTSDSIDTNEILNQSQTEQEIQRDSLLTEDFEQSRKSNLKDAILLKSGVWKLKDAAVISNHDYASAGNRVMRIYKHGMLSMNFDLKVQGYWFLELSCSKDNRVHPTGWAVLVSYDQGLHYKQAFLISDTSLFERKSFSLPNRKATTVRVEIQKLGSKKGYLDIDDVLIGQISNGK